MVLRTNSFRKRELDCSQDIDHDHQQENNGMILKYSAASLFKSRKLITGEMIIKNNNMENINLEEEKVDHIDVDDHHDDLVDQKELANSDPARPAANDDQLDRAATTLQKFYKSYRTRRNLADCAVVVEELWWKGLDFAALKRSSVSFFNSDKSETALSRWARARVRAAKLGKGLSKYEKAQKLALPHWLEAIDPRHRYGQNLRKYYDVWFASESTQPFFYWLDIGDGKEVNLEKIPRTTLQHQCIKYLGPKEREAYEVVVMTEKSGKLVYKQSGVSVETPKETKWIFVLSTSRKLYVAEKKRGLFQHSSFLSGAATIASGRLVAHNGFLEAIWAYSGHYRPTEENLIEVCSFLEDYNVDLTNVKKYPIDDDIPPVPSKNPDQSKDQQNPDPTTDHNNNTLEHSTTPSVDDPIDQANVDESENDHDNIVVEDHHHHLHQEEEELGSSSSKNKPVGIMPRKWSTGAGPRISCVGDYPPELKLHALEQLNLSPKRVAVISNNNKKKKADDDHDYHHGGEPIVAIRGSSSSSCGGPTTPIPSPRPSPKIHLSPRLACSLGLPSPRPSTILHVSSAKY